MPILKKLQIDSWILYYKFCDTAVWNNDRNDIPCPRCEENHPHTMYLASQIGNEQNMNLWIIHFHWTLRKLLQHWAFDSWSLFHTKERKKSVIGINWRLYLHYDDQRSEPKANQNATEELPWKNWICDELQCAWSDLQSLQ